MSIDVGYGYCTNLTEQERLDIDKKVKKNHLALKFAIFIPFFSFFSPTPNLEFYPLVEQNYLVEKLSDYRIESDLAQ